MTLRIVSAAARAAGLLVFALTLVAIEGGSPISGVAEAQVACPPGQVWRANPGRCVTAQNTTTDPAGKPVSQAPPPGPTGTRTATPRRPVCRADQVLIAGKVCGCPAQTRAKMLSPGVFKCMPT